jgi:hypothetical protein
LQESSEQNNLKPGSECYVFSCIAMMWMPLSSMYYKLW